jgi:predicted DNA-binding transcriptional regulator AlpA
MVTLESGDKLLRLQEIVSNPRAKSPNTGLLPMGRSKFLELVKAGVLPQPIRLGTRSHYWRKSDIERFCRTAQTDVAKLAG